MEFIKKSSLDKQRKEEAKEKIEEEVVKLMEQINRTIGEKYELGQPLKTPFLVWPNQEVQDEVIKRLKEQGWEAAFEKHFGFGYEPTRPEQAGWLVIG